MTMNSVLYTGKDISSYMEAFAALGYKPEQVTTILLTHKHGDHSGELKSFPNAKIYVNKDEMSCRVSLTLYLWNLQMVHIITSRKVRRSETGSL